MNAKISLKDISITPLANPGRLAPGEYRGKVTFEARAERIQSEFVYESSNFTDIGQAIENGRNELEKSLAGLLAEVKKSKA